LNWVDPKDKSGEFKRQVSSFRDWIEDKPGAKYPPAKGRYHLYISYACPWAHRTLIYRKLKGLEDIISFSSVGYLLGEGGKSLDALNVSANKSGWPFPTEKENEALNVIPDPLHDPPFHHISQVYKESEPDYASRFTVPVLYDKQTKTIVNNESADIIRMLNHCFDSIVPESAKSDLVPEALESKIESDNSWIYDDINNGVYKSGFATTQEAYEKNVQILFKSLDRAEEHLKSSGPYWFGDKLTETDVRLYTTIVRFDVVYVQHFKCNIRDIRSGYPAIHKWLRHLYWDNDAFKATTEFEHIKKHYTKSHKQINPLVSRHRVAAKLTIQSITPFGPLPDILPKDQEVNAVKV
jgi:glutathionyl-hydroquinone reductase